MGELIETSSEQLPVFDAELLAFRLEAVKSEALAPLAELDGFNPFQTEALRSLLETDLPAVTVDLPTRSGKSFLMSRIAEFAAAAGLTVAIFTPRRHIASEFRLELEESGISTGRIGNGSGELVTVDTVAKLARLGSADVEDVDKVDIVLIDEAHRANGPATVASIERHFPNAVRMSFTATPDFSENRSTTDFHGPKVISKSPLEGIEEGLLSPVQLFLHKTDGVIDNLDPELRDFTPRELKRIANYWARNQKIADYAEDLVSAGRQGVISTIPGNELEHARILAAILKDRTVSSADGSERNIVAEVVSGDRTDTVEVLKAYERGEIDVLLFCDLLTESWTTERASFIINGRPTTSIVNLTQQLGRTMMPKDEITIAVDFIDDSIGKQQRTFYDVLELDRSTQGVLVAPNRSRGSSGVRGKKDPIDWRSIFRPDIQEALIAVDDTKIVDLLYRAVVRARQDDLYRRQRDGYMQGQERDAREFLRRLGPENRDLKKDHEVGPDYFRAHDGVVRVDKPASTGDLVISLAGGSHERKMDGIKYDGRNDRGILPVVSTDDKYFQKELSRFFTIRDSYPSDHDFLAKTLEEALSRLGEKQRMVVEMRFGFGVHGRSHTLEEVGKKYGLTRERIRRIEADALSDLRHNFTLIRDLSRAGIKVNYWAGPSEVEVPYSRSTFDIAIARERLRRIVHDQQIGVAGDDKVADQEKQFVALGGVINEEVSAEELRHARIEANKKAIEQMRIFENSVRKLLDIGEGEALSSEDFAAAREAAVRILKVSGVIGTENDYESLTKVLMVLSDIGDEYRGMLKDRIHSRGGFKAEIDLAAAYRKATDNDKDK